MTAFGGLTPGQLRAASGRLIELNEKQEALGLVDQRITHLPACPHCSHSDFCRWGLTGTSVQRYRCRGCRRTFTSLTGTSFCHIHDKAKLLENAACMREFLSVRKAARRLGVHRNTAFRYRQMMMPNLSKHEPECLEGVAEADEMFFRQSYKGQKSGLPRTAHKRGSPAKKRGLSREQVPVLTVLARGSKESLIRVLAGPANAATVTAILDPILKKDAVLCSDSASAYKTAAANLGVLIRQIPRGSHKLGPYHIQNANALHSRVKNRMRPFRGVATRYLGMYLGWVRFFDRASDERSGRRFFLDAIGLPTSYGS